MLLSRLLLTAGATGRGSWLSDHPQRDNAGGGAAVLSHSYHHGLVAPSPERVDVDQFLFFLFCYFELGLSRK